MFQNFLPAIPHELCDTSDGNILLPPSFSNSRKHFLLLPSEFFTHDPLQNFLPATLHELCVPSNGNLLLPPSLGEKKENDKNIDIFLNDG